MSTPQDNPGTGQNDGRGWNPPGADGSSQPSPYSQQSPYGYQAAQPSGYAYPTSAGAAGPVEKGPAPKEVMRAYYLILAAGVLYLLSSLISALTTEVPDVAGASFGLGLTVVFAVLFAAVYVVLAIFIRKGQNWARITATVLAALNVVITLGTLLLLPLASQAAAAGGQTMPETPALSMALSVLVMLVGAAGVVMTYLKPARPYFAPQRLGY